MKNSMPSSMKELKNKLSGMSQKEKIAYLWSCYKGAIGGTLLAAVLALLICSSIRSASSGTLIAGIRLNAAIRAEGEAYLTEGFMRQLSSGAKTGKAYLQEMTIEAPAAAENNNYYTMLGILSLCSSKDLDYLIMDQTALEAMIAQGVFLDLRSFLEERELAEYSDKLIYARHEGEDAAIPVAIRISHLAFMEDNANGEDLCFGIIKNTPRLENCRRLWDWMLAWQ